MTAEENALSLIQLFRNAHFDVTKRAAKECAITCCNIVLEVVGREVELTGDGQIRAKAEHWNEVRNEILKQS